MCRIGDGREYGLGDNRGDLFRNHYSFASILKVRFAPFSPVQFKENTLNFRSQASHVRGLGTGTPYTKMPC